MENKFNIIILSFSIFCGFKLSRLEIINSNANIKKLIPSYFKNSIVVDTFLKKNTFPTWGLGGWQKLILNSFKKLFVKSFFVNDEL